VNGFENGLILAENRIEYVSQTTRDGNSIFFSATEWNFLKYKKNAYQNQDNFDCVEGVRYPPEKPSFQFSPILAFTGLFLRKRYTYIFLMLIP